MYDMFYKHLLSVLFTLVLVCVFWGGYVAGSHGWFFVWFVFIPIYAMIYSRFGEH